MLMPEPGSAAHLRVFRTGTSFNRLLPKVFNVSITGRALSGVVFFFFSSFTSPPSHKCSENYGIMLSPTEP